MWYGAVLIATRMNVDVKADHGACPIHLAADEGHVEVIRELLSAGSNIDVPATPGCNWTPLFFAAAQVKLHIPLRLS